ncbi:MAG: hypothetical protein RSF40_01595 [Oscillospiraceae bacterium]
MKIIDCLYKVSESPDDYGVRFWDNHGCEGLFPTTIGLKALYQDWWKDCDYCPENDAFIYGIEFFNNATGRVFCAQVDKPFEFTFEDLMHITEDVLGLR